MLDTEAKFPFVKKGGLYPAGVQEQREWGWLPGGFGFFFFMKPRKGIKGSLEGLFPGLQLWKSQVRQEQEEAQRVGLCYVQ